MKYDLEYGLETDRGGLGGLHDVSVHVGINPWGRRGPRTPPRCRSVGRDLVASIARGAEIHIGSAAPLEKQAGDLKHFPPDRLVQH